MKNMILLWHDKKKTLVREDTKKEFLCKAVSKAEATLVCERAAKEIVQFIATNSHGGIDGGSNRVTFFMHVSLFTMFQKPIIVRLAIRAALRSGLSIFL